MKTVFALIGLAVMVSCLSCMKPPAVDIELLEAERSGRLSDVKESIDRGANVNAIWIKKYPRRDSREYSLCYGRAPLHIAVMKKRDKIVEYLIGKKAAVNLKDLKGKRPLDYANRLPGDTISGRIKRMLVEAGAKQGR